MQSLSKQESLDLLEIIEDRHGIKSTIISSQLPVNKWYDLIEENTVADAISSGQGGQHHRNIHLVMP